MVKIEAQLKKKIEKYRVFDTMIKKIALVITLIILIASFAEGGQSWRNDEKSELSSPLPLPFLVDYNPVVADMIQGINESIVGTYVQTLQDFGPRVTGSAASTSASDYIFNQFSSMNLSVSYDPWTSSGYSDRNVEAVINGTNSSSDKIFVVCGHFDSVYGSPGADDNGAGTAAVLTAAQMMKGYNFEHTIRFVTFSGEEQGLLGSYHYAGEASSQADNIVGALNADMIGYTQTSSGGTIVKIYENSASEWITDLAINISSVYQNEIGLTINRLMGSSNSDHYPFWANGYDAIFYHEYEFNPYYHSPNDIIDNMNLTYDAIVTRLIVATLAELAVPAGPLKTDVGVEAIDSPIDNVSYPGGMRNINVTIKNYGWENQTGFNVSCEIIEISEPLTPLYFAVRKQVFYNEITITEQLQFNQSIPVHWEYSFQNISQYLIKIRTLLEGGQCPWNDE